MCRGSVRARRTEDAVLGIAYAITETQYADGLYRQGTLHRPEFGSVPMKDGAGVMVACAACIREATVVIISTIPPALQRLLNVGEREEAMFLPGSDSNSASQDQLRLVDGRQFKLREFAGVGVTLEIPDPNQVSETAPERSALKPAGRERVMRARASERELEPA